MASRQAIYSGTDAPPPHLAIDPVTLSAYLQPRLPGMSGSLAIRKFKGGQSNPTYQIKGFERTYVLRRKPPGKLLESAHAIDREFKVLRALAAADFPVPQPLLYCADVSVIGSEFYIVEHVEGRVFWDAELPGASRADRSAVYDDMNRVLARMHDLDFRAIGLADYAKVGGYAARNLARWSKQYQQSKLIEISDMEWLMRELPNRLPAAESVSLVHGDYGLYNLIVHPTEPRILAVLDWEVSTLGEPLVDLAHHVRAWWDPPDPVRGAVTSLIGQDLAALGIPSLEQYLELYFKRRNLPPADLSFYLGFAQFRYAAIVQGILKRAHDGVSSSREVLHTQERVMEIAAMARRTLSAK
jgi:aminoglycoside phosphotransferase (APT) family kinase protein